MYGQFIMLEPWLEVWPSNLGRCAPLGVALILGGIWKIVWGPEAMGRGPMAKNPGFRSLLPHAHGTLGIQARLGHCMLPSLGIIPPSRGSHQATATHHLSMQG